MISVPVSCEIFYKQIRANLPSKSADPFDASRNFCKRERKREGVRLSRGSVFYIGVGINFYSMSTARDRFFSSRWIRLWVSTNRYTSRVRRLITNHLASNIRVTSSTSSYVRQKIVMQSEKRALDSHTYAGIRENWRGILVQG